MSRPSITEFVDADGVRHELRDPDGPASVAQLRALNRAGRLLLVGPGAVPPVTKGEAAFAVHTEVTAGRVQLRPRRSPADAAKTWEAIVAHVQQHPGCALTDLRACGADMSTCANVSKNSLTLGWS